MRSQGINLAGIHIGICTLHLSIFYNIEEKRTITYFRFIQRNYPKSGSILSNLVLLGLTVYLHGSSSYMSSPLPHKSSSYTYTCPPPSHCFTPGCTHPKYYFLSGSYASSLPVRFTTRHKLIKLGSKQQITTPYLHVSIWKIPVA